MVRGYCRTLSRAGGNLSSVNQRFASPFGIVLRSTRLSSPFEEVECRTDRVAVVAIGCGFSPCRALMRRSHAKHVVQLQDTWLSGLWRLERRRSSFLVNDHLPAPITQTCCTPRSNTCSECKSLRRLPAGGTRFIGVYLARQLIEHGHSVTLLTRGKKEIAYQIPDDTDESFAHYKDSIKHIASDRKDKAMLEEKLSGKKFDGMPTLQFGHGIVLDKSQPARNSGCLPVPARLHTLRPPAMSHLRCNAWGCCCSPLRSERAGG